MIRTPSFPRRAAGCCLVALLVLVGAAPVSADAPMVKTQAPGYYRMMLGDFELTALSDGTAALPMEQIMTGTTPAKVLAALGKAYLTSPVETSFNCYLLNTGAKLVLIDAGSGALVGPTLGKLLGNLKAAGYQPEQVDEIYLTHMHPDHVGGLAVDGKAAFPNAIVRAHRAEGAQWLSQAAMDAAQGEAKEWYRRPMVSLAPYVAAGRYLPFEGETELVPGLRALPKAGHTHGHTIYVIESKQQKLVLWGDLVHLAAVQFANPGVAILMDTDAKKATVQRKKAFAEAAKHGYYVGISHVSFPGLGQLRAEGKGYRFYPINYTGQR